MFYQITCCSGSLIIEYTGRSALKSMWTPIGSKKFEGVFFSVLVDSPKINLPNILTNESRHWFQRVASCVIKVSTVKIIGVNVLEKWIVQQLVVSRVINIFEIKALINRNFIVKRFIHIYVLFAQNLIFIFYTVLKHKL